MTARTPLVTALVVNYNGWRDTIECLESIRTCDYPALRVVVLDNGSADDSLARLGEWLERTSGHAVPVELLALGANLGFGGANNVGMRRILEDPRVAHAWLVNNDAIVATDALSKMVATAASDVRIAAVGATLLRYDRPDIIETAGGGRVAEWHGMTQTVLAGAPRNAPRSAVDIDFISGTCMLVPRETLARVGLFDERFFLYGEDIDWSMRMRESGLRLAYCAEAEVWHKGGGTTVHRSPVHDYHNVKASLLLVHKRRPALVPLALAYSVARCLLPKIARGDWLRLRAVTRGYLDFARQAAGGRDPARQPS